MGKKPRQDITDLLKYSSVRSWLEGLDKKYQRKLLEYFIKFIDYTKLNPDQMLDLRRQDLVSKAPDQQRRFERLAKSFYEMAQQDCKERGKGEGTAWNYVKSTMSFFSRNYLPLHFKRKELKLPKKKPKKTGLTIEKLKEAYALLDLPLHPQSHGLPQSVLGLPFLPRLLRMHSV